MNEPAEQPNPNAVILAALAANADRHRALTESIFGPAESETPDQEEGDE